MALPIQLVVNEGLELIWGSIGLTGRYIFNQSLFWISVGGSLVVQGFLFSSMYTTFDDVPFTITGITFLVLLFLNWVMVEGVI